MSLSKEIELKKINRETNALVQNTAGLKVRDKTQQNLSPLESYSKI